MCGRLTLRSDPDTIAEHFQLASVPPFSPSYNVAPSQTLLAVVRNPESGARSAHIFDWGFIPSWSKDGKGWINARIESAATKPSFRSAFSKRRCLIPADGFYEWTRPSSSSAKRPFYFTFEDNRVFSFCGIWEKSKQPDGTIIQTCAILTTKPNKLLTGIHHRMPVIAGPERYDLWLEGLGESGRSSEGLAHIFEVPYENSSLTVYPVSSLVNNPRNNSPLCVERIE